MGAQNALLERESELADIEAALDDAAAAAGGPLIVEGVAGAGKTALLGTAAELAEGRGMTVLRARGGEYERDLPYGVLRQLFGPLFAADPGARESLSERAALAAPIFEAAPSRSAAAVDRFEIQEGIYWLIADLGEASPLALLVDDAQWADVASLQAFAFVARRLDGIAAACLLTVRSGEGGPGTGLLEEIRSEPGARAIVPAPLSAGAVARLARDESGRLPSDAFSEACRTATGGNPFLLIELMRALSAEGAGFEEESAEDLARHAAAGASRAILSRLARLGPGETEVARAVAILEPNAEQRLVVAMTGLGSDQVIEAGERLVAASLLAGTRPLSFAHPLVREAVLSDMGEARRGAAHVGAARRLDEDGADPDTVASHLLLAEPAADLWVVETLRATAASAMARGAPTAAVGYLRRALREPPQAADRVDVRRELGLALVRSDSPEGMEVLGGVRGEIEDPNERAEVTAVLANSTAFRGGGKEAAAILSEALEETEGVSDGLLTYLRLHSALLLSGGVEGLPDGVLPEPAEDLPGDPTFARALLGQSAMLCMLGLASVETAMAYAERVGLDSEEEDADAVAGFPHNPLHVALVLADRGDLVAGRFEHTIGSSARRGTLSVITAAYGIRAYGRLVEGELAEAQVDAETAARLASQADFLIAVDSWTGAAVRAATGRGDFERARFLLERNPGERTPNSGLPGALVLQSRGELRQALGEHAGACEDFRSVGERLGWLPLENPEALGWRSGLAVSLGALGEREAALGFAAESLDKARGMGGARGIGTALRVQGSLVDSPEGVEMLREASELLGGTRAKPQLALALVELGAALRRANHRKESREPLREGMEIAHRCGALPLEERARSELAAAGARPRSVMRSGLDALTPSELRVATLAAQGMTNRQIAQSLTVTSKTVETHLRHVFQKLDLAKRTELPAVLDRD